MRRRRRWLVLTSLALLFLSSDGCKPAERYGSRVAPPSPPIETGTKSSAGETLTPLDPGILWEDPGLHPPLDDVRIEFVHAGKDPQTWQKLPQFWNAPLLSRPDAAVTIFGLSPLLKAALACDASVVRIKVPLGLEDPAPQVPASNPMTLGKWKLGRRLFFSDTWLEDKKEGAHAGASCAGCHRPQNGFTDGVQAHADGFNTPTLINCVFNSRQFWDGRTANLEEVVQRCLDDERQPSGPDHFHHVWHAVIGRLREDSSITYQFQQVFGTPPTQDSVGRALATYLRTLLAANSIHDQAEELARRAGTELDPAPYKAVLTRPGVLDRLDRSRANPEQVARELFHGYALFTNREGRGRANCVACHSGRQFTDEGFHNLGWDESAPEPGKERGRFASVPIGQKDRYLIDAYKTPTLRSLLRTGPYLHTGRATELREVIAHHARAGEYLDPLMRDHAGRIRSDELTDEEIDALVLFLRALDGEEPAPILCSPQEP